jgi:hypothetical protein
MSLLSSSHRRFFAMRSGGTVVQMNIMNTVFFSFLLSQRVEYKHASHLICMRFLACQNNTGVVFFLVALFCFAIKAWRIPLVLCYRMEIVLF